ncbi:MAG: hypothetical protein AAF802_06955 [Planctomycetota bacterium]
MGTTFVGIGDNGFWMRDGVLELWLRLLALHLEDPADDSSPCDAIRSQWLLASRGSFNGCVLLDLGSDISTAAGRKLILEAITSLRSSLENSPETLDHHVLNLLGFSGPFSGNPETWRLIDVADAFVDLIEGRVTRTVETTEWMPGSTKRN